MAARMLKTCYNLLSKPKYFDFLAQPDCRVALFSMYEVKTFKPSEGEHFDPRFIPTGKGETSPPEEDYKQQKKTRTKKGSAVSFLSTALSVGKEQVEEELNHHPMSHLVLLQDVEATVSYLKSMGFENHIIYDSLCICLYPRFAVEEGLRKVFQNEYILNTVGISLGITQYTENIFQNGMKYPDRRLQLCLYYMEQEFNFTGNGVFVKL